MIYCWPKFGEGIIGRGMGFGNRLFPWARCRLYARNQHVQMISPVWVRPAIGQLFRGGVDYKAYLRQLVLFGLFHKRKDDLGLLEGAVMSRKIPVVTETEANQNRWHQHDDGKSRIVVFRGLERYFEPLQGSSDYLRNELTAITNSRYLSIADRYPSVPVGMCIRCGNDFDPCPVDRSVLKPGEKTPIEWFAQVLALIRKEVGYTVAAYIVSDGTREQLKSLLSLDNVNLVRPGSAISDLLVMSKSKVLLASGSSSFAAWGAFLGQMPTVSHPGQNMREEWGITPEKGQYLSEFHYKEPDGEFLRQVKAVLGNPEL
jgi:hypothetical protein